MSEITLFAMPGSPASEAAKKHLHAKNIDYQEVDVSQPENAQKLARESGQWSAPVLIVSGQVVVGFDPEAYDKFLPK